jgi:hypothetical protein
LDKKPVFELLKNGVVERREGIEIVLKKDIVLF